MNPTQKQPTTAPADQPIGTILRGAAAYLSRYGWLQGDYYRVNDQDPFPAACTVGAVSVAICGRLVGFIGDLPADEGNLARRTIRFLASHLNDDKPIPDLFDAIGYVTDWNDEPERTKAEVIDLLITAADTFDRTTGGAA